MAIVIGKGAGGGGGSSSGFKLGPLPNTFRVTGLDSKAAAIALRDAAIPTGGGTHADWLAGYEADPTLTIALEYEDAAGNEVAEMQLYDLIAGSLTTYTWYDSATFKGLRGIQGDAGLTPYYVYAKNTDPDTPPTLPVGTAIPPTGWADVPMAPSDGEYVWSSVTLVEDYAVPISNGHWEVPVRATGREGTNAVNDSFTVVVDGPTRMAIPTADLKIGTHVYQLDNTSVYVNTTGSNGTAADWKKKTAYDTTYTGDVTMDGDFRYDNDEVHIGRNSGVTTQGARSVAIGRFAGNDTQGTRSVAVGVSAAQTRQGSSATALGDNAGEVDQGNNTVAVGKFAGQTNQGTESVAIGDSAGMNDQGVRAVALGIEAGTTNQPNRSIIINANNAPLNKTNEGALGIHTGGANALEIDYDGGATDNLRINKTVEADGFIGDGIVPTPPATGKVLTSNGTGSNDYTWADPTSGGGGGIVDAPIDGNMYARKDGNWANVDDADHTWTGNHQFNRDVTTLGKFVGVGAIDNVDQSIGRVLTANSGTEGDYTWKDAPAGTGSSDFVVVADQAALLALTPVKDGMRVRVVADDVEYINLLGFNRTIADWKNVLSYETTFTSQVRIEDHKIQLGQDAGKTNQGDNATSVGAYAGTTDQGDGSVAIGELAGNTSQGEGSVAIGIEAGETSQGVASVAIGNKAAELNQSEDAVAIGNQAGYQGQGFDSIAIGHEAGKTHQANRGIILNASGAEKNHTTDGHLGVYTGGSHPLNITYTGGAGQSLKIDQDVEVTGTAKFVGKGAIPEATEDDRVLTSHADGTVTWEFNESLYRAVPDIATRNAIPLADRTEGMSVYVETDEIVYTLIGGVGDLNWVGHFHEFTIQDDLIGRDNIHASQRTIGLHCYVIADNKTYVLIGGVANANWTEAAGGGFDVTANYTVTGDWQFQGDVRSSSNEVHLGNNAGITTQGANSVAVGTNAGNNTQGTNAVAVGNRAGRVNQGNSAVAVGLDAGNSGQGEDSVAIGHNAGSADQGDNSIIISSKGTDVNNTNDGSLQIETDVVTIRHDGDAGGNLRVNQVIEPQGLLTNGGVQVTGSGSFVGTGSVPSTGMATGHILTANSAVAGDYEWKASSAVAVAGANFFLANDLAGRMGIAAADLNAGAFCIQIDTQRMYVNLTGNNGDPNIDWKDWGAFDHTFTGEFRLESDEVHLGKDAGMTTPGTDSVAIGRQAGQTSLGDYAVALGFLAGAVSQGNNSIVINSSANNVSNTHANSLTINTGELQMNFNGATNDHLTINKEIDVTDITITAPRLITGVPI